MELNPHCGPDKQKHLQSSIVSELPDGLMYRMMAAFTGCPRTNFQRAIEQLSNINIEKVGKGQHNVWESLLLVLAQSTSSVTGFQKIATALRSSLPHTNPQTKGRSQRCACFRQNSFLLLLLRGGEPLVQQLLAVVDLPAVHLHSNDDHQVHDRYS